jgi:hypothetical protein
MAEITFRRRIGRHEFKVANISHDKYAIGYRNLGEPTFVNPPMPVRQAGHTLDHKAASALICEVMAMWNDRVFKRWVDDMIVDHDETGFDDAYRSA